MRKVFLLLSMLGVFHVLFLLNFKLCKSACYWKMYTVHKHEFKIKYFKHREINNNIAFYKMLISYFLKMLHKSNKRNSLIII